MIRVYLGNTGSGKTACAVYDMIEESHNHFFSNIRTELSHVTPITRDMIITEQTINKKNEKSLNRDYWEAQNNKYGKLSVTLDEAHTLINSRKAMSKDNIIMNDFLAMLRRVLGGANSSEGMLTIISQLYRKIDVVGREMAHQVRYHVMHYMKTCKNCTFTWEEISEAPEQLERCPRCNSPELTKYNHVCEVWRFQGMNNFIQFKELNLRTYYMHYYISDIEKVFGLYNTKQWESML